MNKLRWIGKGAFVFMVGLAAPVVAGTNTIIVTSEASRGAGTLYQAVLDANDATEATSILFDAAVSEVLLTDVRLDIGGEHATTIDGEGRVTIRNDGTVSSPVIIREGGHTIRGLIIEDAFGNAVEIAGSDAIVDGCVIVGAEFNGVSVSGIDGTTGVRIMNSYIGVWPDGTADPNGVFAIRASDATQLSVGLPGAGNVIVAKEDGEAMNIRDCVDLSIRDNFVGVDPTGTMGLGGFNGIDLQFVAGAEVINNVVGDQTSSAIVVLTSEGFEGGFTIQRNLIGRGVDGSPLPNGVGISIRNYSEGLVGGTMPADGNVVVNSVNEGISLGFNTQGITIRHNLVFDNGTNIFVGDANGGIMPPEITGTGPLQGTTVPNGLVDVYSGDTGAEAFIETVQADASGNFVASFKGIAQVRVQATDPAGNSSALSAPVEADIPEPSGCASGVESAIGANAIGDVLVLFIVAAGLACIAARRSSRKARGVVRDV